MLKYEDMDVYELGQVNGGARVEGAPLLHLWEIINAATRGATDPTVRIELVDLGPDYPVTGSSALYITTPGQRIFAVLVSYELQLRAGVHQIYRQVDEVWQNDWSANALGNDLSTLAGARRFTERFDPEAAADLRREADVRDKGCKTLLSYAETPAHWLALPPGTRIEAWAWPVVELTPRQRAEKFLRYARVSMPGSSPSKACLDAATGIRDAGCTEDEAFELMSERWNERCTPPWHPAELRKKIRAAYRKEIAE